MQEPCVYTLVLSHGHRYVGCTGNLRRRLRQHRRGYGAKVLRGSGPFRVEHVYYLSSAVSRAELVCAERLRFELLRWRYGPAKVRGANRCHPWNRPRVPKLISPRMISMAQRFAHRRKMIASILAQDESPAI